MWKTLENHMGISVHTLLNLEAFVFTIYTWFPPNPAINTTHSSKSWIPVMEASMVQQPLRIDFLAAATTSHIYLDLRFTRVRTKKEVRDSPLVQHGDGAAAIGEQV